MATAKGYPKYPCAPKGYAPDEYEYLKEKLSNSNFDLSIESLCRSFKNYAETGRFVDFQSNYDDRYKTPKKVLNVLFQNSVWYCSYELTPKSNLIYWLRIGEPYIVDLNVEGELAYANVYKNSLIGDEARLWYEAILEEINNNPQERVLNTDWENLYGRVGKRFVMGNHRRWNNNGGVISYIKVVDDTKYLIQFNFSSSFGSLWLGDNMSCIQYAAPQLRDKNAYNLQINIVILSVGEEKLSEMIRREEKEIEMEEYIKKQKEEALKREEEERKRREEEERMRKEEEERRKAEEIKRQAEIKYKAEISKLL